MVSSKRGDFMELKDITKIDKNYANEEIKYDGLTTYNILQEPFEIFGLYKTKEEGTYKRMPQQATEGCNNSIKNLYTNTSGGRVRFRTDSTRIVLRCILPSLTVFSHMPRTGTSCFDLYVDGKYFNVFRPGIDIYGGYSSSGVKQDGFESGYTLGEKKMRDIEINFPLYNDVTSVFLALEQDATIEKSKPYTNQKPIVFYGSSITQGGCASHPGNSYPLIISRELDSDIINLGFSAGCVAEPEMAEYISSLDISALVYDYDHNAQSVEQLLNSHERFFLKLREKKPDLPVVIVTAADFHFGAGAKDRMLAIKKTYDNALLKGDKNVYFINGQTIYEPFGRENCTVDNTHANDLGFRLMANSIGKVLKDILAESSDN